MIKILLISILLFSCNTDIKIQEIEIGKTIKIEPTNFHSSDNNLTFLWEPPKCPSGSKPFIDIKKNKMLFSADLEGKYQINLIIETNGKSIYEETFLLNATKSESNFTSINIDNTKETKKNNINKKYTIQVASWPNLEQARKDQISLRDNGYDAYTEQYYIKSKNQLWWRVRVGNFSDKKIADKITKKLSKFRGNDIWIDVIE